MEYLSRKKKSFKILFLFLFLLISLGFLYGYFFIRSSRAPLEGERSLRNLTEKVSVIRDGFGIPHIKAKNTIDAFRSLGFVVASERLFQMEIMRRMAAGELSEIFGRKTLASDKLFRTLGLTSIMNEMLEKKKSLHQLDPQMWAEMEAFYDGVNQFQESGKLPLEFSILGIKPRPFSALDAYSFVGLMSFSFGVATSAEPLMTELRVKLGDELADELRNDPVLNGPKVKAVKRIVNNNSVGHYPVAAILADLEKGFPLFEGSNGWLLSGARTKSGFPILANDPHITYTQPGIWFEAHIITPDYETYGHFFPLLPFPVLAHNKERGWGLTMSLIDDMDLFREKLNPKFKSYEFKSQSFAYKERLETIKIKGERAQTLVILETQHGPIMDDVFTKSADKSLALSWAFRSIENDPLLAFYKMGRAHNMEEFKAAVALGKAPGLNVLYADKKNIGWWIFGEMTKKSMHTPSDFILDGSTGLDEHLGSLSFLEKPHKENPSSGIIISANSSPEGLSKLGNGIRGDWQPDDRYKSLQSILNQKELWSIEDLKIVQTLNINLENKLILAALLEGINFRNLWKEERAKSYLSVLKNWDFISHKDSIAPSLYYTWCREITKILLSDLSPDEFETFTKLPNNWIFFKKVVLDPDSPWWKKRGRKRVFTEAFNNTIESLREQFGEDSTGWSWGHLHTLEFVHPIGKVAPFNRLFNLGPVGMNGAAHEINNQKQAGYSEGFKIKAGPSTRRLIDFAHPEKAWGILPTGNSGHILSPFYKDQLELFAEGLYREEWLDEKAIQAHKTYELMLLPKAL
jgi:penicillin amidase